MNFIGTDNIRDVIAFPKTQIGSDLMTKAAELCAGGSAQGCACSEHCGESVSPFPWWRSYHGGHRGHGEGFLVSIARVG